MNKFGSFLAVSYFTGLVSGLTIGLLLAPKEGKETRSLIRRAVDSGWERLGLRDDDES